MTTLDPLSDILRVLRVGGSLVLNDTYTTPWSVNIPPADRLAELTGIVSGSVVAFHFVQKGQLELTTGDTAIKADRGDLLVCFGGHHHELSWGDGATPQPLEDLIGLRCPSTEDLDDGATTLLCGVFSLGALLTTPLARGLPPVVHLERGTGGEFDTLAELLAAEVAARRPGMEFTVGRILEMVCAEALRHVARQAPKEQQSWFRALSDPAVFAALCAIHDDPAHNWNMAALGHVAAMSPSRLTTRFRETLGQSPIAYLTQWRMIIGAQLLVDTDMSVQQIAEEVGYGAQPAFTRSFTRHYGSSPRAYRGSDASVV